MSGRATMPPPRGFSRDRVWVLGCIASRGALVRYAAHPADLPCPAVEVRLDLIGLDAPRWLERCRALRAAGVRVLLTLRVRREGGSWSGPAAARWPVLRDALAKSAADAVDWELLSADASRMAARLAPWGGADAWVASWHRFSGPCDAARFDALARRADAYGARWIKFAVEANTPRDWSRLAHEWNAFLSRRDSSLPCPFLSPMGACGGDHRIDALPPATPALLFGSLSAPTAPGQPTAASLSSALPSAPAASLR